MLLLGGGVIYASCIVSIFCDEFIPFVMRSMSKGQDRKTPEPDLKSAPTHAQPSLGPPYRFRHHAVLGGPSLYPRLHPLCSGGRSAAGENGEEGNGHEQEEQVWL